MSTNKQLAAKQNKTNRIIAIIIAALSVLGLVLPIKAFAGGTTTTHISFALLGKMFTSAHKKFGFIPLIADGTSALNRLSSYALFAYAVALLAILAFAIVAIVLTVKAPNAKKTVVWTQIATYGFTFICAMYSLSVLVSTSYVDTTSIVVDVTTLVLALLGAVAYLILLLQKFGRKGWFYVLQFTLSFIVLALVMLAYTHHGKAVAAALDKDPNFKEVAFTFILGALAVAVCSSLCVFFPKKDYADNVISFIIACVQAAVIFAMAIFGSMAQTQIGVYDVYVLIAGILSFVQLIASFVLIFVAKKYIAEKAEDSTFINELADDEYIAVRPYEGGPVAGIYVAEVVEENIEVVPYEGGPVDGIQVAEVVEEDAPAAEACECAESEAAEEAAEPEEEITDAFLLTLTKEERAQFTEIYIDKTVNMPEIPAYVVDGDNKNFFNKVFIYIGQYRQNIPNAILAKMYDFSLTL